MQHIHTISILRVLKRVNLYVTPWESGVARSCGQYIATNFPIRGGARECPQPGLGLWCSEKVYRVN